MGVCIGGAVLEKTYDGVDVRTLKLTFRFAMADNRTRGVF